MTLALENLDPELVRRIEAAIAKGEAVTLMKAGRPYGELHLNAAPKWVSPVDWTPGRGAHTVTHVGDVVSPVVDEKDVALERGWF